MLLGLPANAQAIILSHLVDIDLCRLEQIFGKNADNCLEVAWKNLIVENEFMTRKSCAAKPNTHGFKRLFAAWKNLVKNRYIFTSCKYTKMLMKKCLSYAKLRHLFVDQISLVPQRKQDYFDYRVRLPDDPEMLEHKGKGKGKARMTEQKVISSIPIDAGHLGSYYIYGTIIWYIGENRLLYSQSIDTRNLLTVHRDLLRIKDLKGSSLGYLMTRDEFLRGITVWHILKDNLAFCEKRHYISVEGARAFATHGSKLAILHTTSVAIFDIVTGNQITRINGIPALYESNLLFVDIDLTSDYIGLAASTEQESFFHVFKEENHGFYSLVQAKKTVTTITSGFPTTFAIRNNFILTSGPNRNNINLYHISQSANAINLLTTISENEANTANGFMINQKHKDQDLTAVFADDTTIIGIVSSEYDARLLIWDFAIERPCNRNFTLAKLGGMEGRMKMFIVFDDE